MTGGKESPDVMNAINALVGKNKPAKASKVAEAPPKQVAPRRPVPVAPPPAPTRPMIDPALATRRKADRAEQERRQKMREREAPRVSSPLGGAIVDLAFNASPDKIREMTIIDSYQAKLFPLLDTTNHMFNYCLEIALYRHDPNEYRETFEKDYPEQPDIIEHLLYRTAQWQKSRAGKNLERATDMALADIESKQDDNGGGFGNTNPYNE